MPVEILKDFTGCPLLEKGPENKGDAILDFTVRVLLDAFKLVTYEADGKLQCEFATLRFIEEPGVHPRFDGKEFCLRKSTFQAEQQTAIRSGRVIDAITICDEAAFETADIE